MMGYLENRYYRYLPPSPRDKDWGLYVSDAGCTEIPPNSYYPPPGHPKDYNFTIERGRILHSFQIVYFTDVGGYKFLVVPKGYLD